MNSFKLACLYNKIFESSRLFRYRKGDNKMRNNDYSLGINYKDVSIIFDQYTNAEEMYVILAGRVEVIKNKNGLKTKLATLE